MKIIIIIILSCQINLSKKLNFHKINKKEATNITKNLLNQRFFQNDYDKDTLIPIEGSGYDNFIWDYGDSGKNWRGICQFGRQQSPVNIPLNEIMNAKTSITSDISLRFAYKEHIENKIKMRIGKHGLEILSKAENFDNEYDNNQLGTMYIHLPNQHWNAYAFDITKIELKTPSEHSINGQHQPLELQIYHRINQKRSAFDQQAYMIVNKGRIKNAAFSIFFQGGEENELIGSILKTLDKFKDKQQYSENDNTSLPDLSMDEVYEVEEERVQQFMKGFDLNKFFFKRDMGFFGDNLHWPQILYFGSIPHPPCTENTIWILPITYATASSEQLKQIDKLFKIIKPSRAIRIPFDRDLWLGEQNAGNIITNLDGTGIHDYNNNEVNTRAWHQFNKILPHENILNNLPEYRKNPWHESIQQRQMKKQNYNDLFQHTVFHNEGRN